MNRLKFVVAGAPILALLAQSAQAGSGADLLLRSTRGKADSSASGAVSRPDTDPAVGMANFKLDDPFSIQFYSAWQSVRSDLPPELNHWATMLLKGDAEGAAHLWTGIEKQLPAAFGLAARLGHLSALARLGLPQTFVDGWLDFLATDSGAWSRPGKATALVVAFEASLESLFGKRFDLLVSDGGILLTSEQQVSALKLDAKSLPSVATLQSLATLRQGRKGEALLTLLPANHAYKVELAQTVALAHARSGDLAAAATVLKNHAEPALEARGNLLKVSSHLLQIARFLFQAGMWEESEGYLRKIPNTAPEFLAAREELAWILLRRGDVANLRGEVASLSTRGTQGSFHPELPVVRAISNLKLCSFGGVQKDFAEFQAEYGGWAKRIETALSAAELPRPETPDDFVLSAERRRAALQVESGRLNELHSRSLQSTLPSVVGRQAHWKLSQDRMNSKLQLASQLVQAEFRRDWRNRKAMLSEAIRKMRFVKIELLHQMNVLARDNDRIATSQAAALSRAPADEGRQVFPLDGVLWPDEFFRIQGSVEQRCLKGVSP